VAPVSVFVAQRGNQFMVEIAGWIAEAAGLTGRKVDVIDDRLPRVDGSINLVVAPHEFFELYAASRKELHRAAAASIGINTEQPGTSWFRVASDACRRGSLALDISDQGADALRDDGISVERLRLGGVPTMRAASADTSDRPIDVLFLGGIDDRRGAAFAELAPHLWRRSIDLRFAGGDRPINAATPQTVFGADKQRLLSSSKVLLNIHRDRSSETASPYFEWARAVETMANGCVVITEPSQGCEPLVAGTHFIEAEIGGMAAAIEALLNDEGQRAAIADRAREAMFGELAMVDSLGPLLDRIETDVLPTIATHRAAISVRDLAGRWKPRKGTPKFGAFQPFQSTLATAKRLAMAENAALQRLDAAACELAHGDHQHIVRIETPSFADSTPEVSVVVSLYNYAAVVNDTLDSIAASEGIEFELIVVEDHATDDSRAVVQRFIDTHPSVPMALIGKDANEGLAAARNTGFAEARAPLVMVMDADNTIYPSCLRKLADALHDNDNDTVDAAYSILEDFGEQRNIRGALAWDVDRLCRANYIDAQSMIRRSAWERLGGYRSDDEFVYGWEDWDLWLRLAAEGGQAMLVTQILGRYRVQRGSMVGLTNLATDDAIAAIRKRYPTLPWPCNSAAGTTSI
jgi:Glycosyl transferase family 2/Glycosyl transferases group 1